MKLVLFAGALVATASASLCQEAVKDLTQAKDGEIVEITAHTALSYTGDKGQTVTELTAPTLKVFRSDKKGGKTKGTVFMGTSAKVESSPGGGAIQQFFLKGNVRAEEPDGTITTADEAVIDLVKGIYTYTGKTVRIVSAEK